MPRSNADRGLGMFTDPYYVLAQRGSKELWPVLSWFVFSVSSQSAQTVELLETDTLNRRHRLKLLSYTRCSQSGSIGSFGGSTPMVSHCRLQLLQAKYLPSSTLCPLTCNIEYDLKDHSAWADNVLVATVQAYQVADYFLAKDLMQELTIKLINAAMEFTAIFQNLSASGTCQDDFCKTLYGKNTRGLLEDFSSAVRQLYSASCPGHNYLREVYVEFGVRTQLIALQYPEYVTMLREVPAFGADVLIASHRGPSSIEPFSPDTPCNACCLKIFQKKYHIARWRLVRSELHVFCSECFDDWEFPNLE